MGVFVAGMYLTGGSVVARMLEAIGYYFGSDDEMLPGKYAGYKDRREVVRLNNEILSAGLASWDYPKVLNEDFWTKYPQVIAELEARARVVVDQLESHDLWAIKDPRLSFTLPFWRGLVTNSRVIITVRNPFETTQSIGKRHFLTENYGTSLWCSYYESLLGLVKPEECLVMDFHSLLADPQREAKRLFQWLDVDADEVMLTKAKSAVKPWLNSVRQGGEDYRFGLPRFQKLKALWEQMGDGQWNPADYNEEWLAIKKKPVRTVIVHYHLYKNAGTSIDRILQNNFGKEHWIKWEGQAGVATAESLVEFLHRNPEIKAVSTHLGELRVPSVEGLRILPIIFLRHPLNRVGSVYRFERKQILDAPGPNHAKEMDLKAYVLWRLNRLQDRQFRNFQTCRLAAWEHGDQPELAKAIHALNDLPFIGCVENFEDSLRKLENWLSLYFPSFKVNAVRANVSQESEVEQEEQFRNLRDELGEELFARLVAANEDDLLLYGKMMVIQHNEPKTE